MRVVLERTRTRIPIFTVYVKHCRKCGRAGSVYGAIQSRDRVHWCGPYFSVVHQLSRRTDKHVYRALRSAGLSWYEAHNRSRTTIKSSACYIGKAPKLQKLLASKLRERGIDYDAKTREFAKA